MSGEAGNYGYGEVGNYGCGEAGNWPILIVWGKGSTPNKASFYVIGLYFDNLGKGSMSIKASFCVIGLYFDNLGKRSTPIYEIEK